MINPFVRQEFAVKLYGVASEKVNNKIAYLNFSGRQTVFKDMCSLPSRLHKIPLLSLKKKYLFTYLFIYLIAIVTHLEQVTVGR